MKSFFVFIAAIVLLTGCTTTQKSAGIGAVGGGALGGIIGHQSGNAGTGAAIGAAAGAIGGVLVGEKLEKKFCPECGAEYTSGDQFCPKDGTELKQKQ